MSAKDIDTTRKYTKPANLFLCFSLLIGLQVMKPTLFMEVYRFAFNFDPHLYSNWELYKMVWSKIQAGAMSGKVIMPLLLAEVIWIILPFGFYRLLAFNESEKQQVDL